MQTSMDKVPLGLFNEILESGIIEIDHSLHRMSDAKKGKKKK